LYNMEGVTSYSTWQVGKGVAVHCNHRNIKRRGGREKKKGVYPSNKGVKTGKTPCTICKGEGRKKGGEKQFGLLRKLGGERGNLILELQRRGLSATPRQQCSSYVKR